MNDAYWVEWMIALGMGWLTSNFRLQKTDLGLNLWWTIGTRVCVVSYIIRVFDFSYIMNCVSVFSYIIRVCVVSCITHVYMFSYNARVLCCEFYCPCFCCYSVRYIARILCSEFYCPCFVLLGIMLVFCTVGYYARVLYCWVLCSCFVLLGMLLVLCTVGYVTRALYC